MTDNPRRYADIGVYVASGRAADAARHLLAHSELHELCSAAGPLSMVEDRDQFHLAAAVITYTPIDKILLGFLAAICEAAPPFHCHVHDLQRLDIENRRVVVEAVIIAAGFGSPDCNFWPAEPPVDLAEDTLCAFPFDRLARSN